MKLIGVQICTIQQQMIRLLEVFTPNVSPRFVRVSDLVIKRKANKLSGH